MGRGSLTLLSYLKDGPATLSDIKEDLRMGNDTLYEAMNSLIKNELALEISKGPARIFMLTEKGKRLFFVITLAEKILNDDSYRQTESPRPTAACRTPRAHADPPH